MLVVAGPTGSGKTELALEIARRLPVEVVGCDALQVYRGFDRATAKPTPAERAQVPHHLVDCIDPTTDLSVAEYVRRADAALHEIAERGRVPVVVGGSGMYLRGLLRGIVGAGRRNPELRARLAAMFDRFGAARMHRWLVHLDPASARRVGPGDRQRMLRAIEFRLAEGRRWSDVLAREGTWDGASDRYRSLKVAIDLPRDALAARLDARVERFFAEGLIEEVEGLLRTGVPTTANAFKAIGYREVLASVLAGKDPSESIAAVQRSTRRYAKRQRTWLRSERDLIWLDGSRGAADLARTVVDRWRDRFD